MSERMVIYARQNLSELGDAGVPAFVGTGKYKLEPLPAALRFTPGDVSVYSQSENRTFAYVGVLSNVHLDRTSGHLTFSDFQRWRSPLVIYDETNPERIVDNRALWYEAEKGWFNEFSYIEERAFQRAIDAHTASGG